jgi:hypothetical protein
MKRPVKLYAQRQTGKARVDCLIDRGRIRTHIWSFPESQIFYVAPLLRERRMVRRRAFPFLNRGVFPFILEVSPKNRHSTLNLGIKSTLRFHLLSTGVLVEYGSCVAANLNTCSILNPNPGGFQPLQNVQRVKRSLQFLTRTAPITPVLVEDYG